VTFGSSQKTAGHNLKIVAARRKAPRQRLAEGGRLLGRPYDEHEEPDNREVDDDDGEDSMSSGLRPSTTGLDLHHL
jgi:hypothetical protein